MFNKEGLNQAIQQTNLTNKSNPYDYQILVLVFKIFQGTPPPSYETPWMIHAFGPRISLELCPAISTAAFTTNKRSKMTQNVTYILSHASSVDL